MRRKRLVWLIAGLIGWHTAEAAGHSPDEVAMILATSIAATQECKAKQTDYPLNLAVAKLGQDLVDFMPDGRYAPIVDVKMKKAVEWIAADGKAKACAGMVEVLRKYLPDIYR